MTSKQITKKMRSVKRIYADTIHRVQALAELETAWQLARLNEQQEHTILNGRERTKQWLSKRKHR